MLVLSSRSRCCPPSPGILTIAMCWGWLRWTSTPLGCPWLKPFFWDSWVWRGVPVENGRIQRSLSMQSNTFSAEGHGKGWTHCEPKIHGSTMLYAIHWCNQCVILERRPMDMTVGTAHCIPHFSLTGSWASWVERRDPRLWKTASKQSLSQYNTNPISSYKISITQGGRRVFPFPGQMVIIKKKK